MFFGWFNTVFSIVFPLIFFGLMCLFIFTLISNLRTWNKNKSLTPSICSSSSGSKAN